MRLLYLHQYFATPDSAGGTRSYEMAKRMKERGIKVTIVTTSAFFPKKYVFNSGWNRIEIDGIDLVVFKQEYSNKTSFIKRLFCFFEFMVAAIIKVSSLKYDLVFASSTPLTICIPGVFASKIKKVPMVFEVRDLWPEVPIELGILKNPILKMFARRLESFAYRNSKGIVALSSDMASSIADSGVSEDKIICIPNCSDISLFDVPADVGIRYRAEYLSFVGNRRLVVYTGTFGVVNNVGYLVDIAVEASKRGDKVCFVAFGDGMEKHQVIERASEMGVLNKNLYVFEPISKKEVVKVLSACDLTLSLVGPNPVMWKNSANKLFDAFAAKKPIGISHGGWQKKLLEENNCGFAFDHVDPNIAAAQISEKVTNEGWLRDATVNSSKLAQIFSRDSMANKLIQFLLDIHKS